MFQKALERAADDRHGGWLARVMWVRLHSAIYRLQDVSRAQSFSCFLSGTYGLEKLSSSNWIKWDILLKSPVALRCPTVSLSSFRPVEFTEEVLGSPEGHCIFSYTEDGLERNLQAKVCKPFKWCSNTAWSHVPWAYPSPWAHPCWHDPPKERHGIVTVIPCWLTGQLF